MGPWQADTKNSTSIQLRYCMVRYRVHAGRLLTHTRWACKAFRVDPAQHESLWHRTSFSTTNKYWVLPRHDTATWTRLILLGMGLKDEYHRKAKKIRFPLTFLRFCAGVLWHTWFWSPSHPPFTNKTNKIHCLLQESNLSFLLQQRYPFELAVPADSGVSVCRSWWSLLFPVPKQNSSCF